MKKMLISAIIAFVFLAGCSSASSSSATTSYVTNSSTASVETKPVSKIKSSSMYSQSLGLDWNYSIYLPEGYDAEGNSTQYPVLFLLHGAYGNHRNMVERFPIETQLDTLISNNQLQKTIVVFVDGFNSFYINGPTLKMEDAIMNDLLPYINTTYRVKSGRENYSIGGISMGGYGTANLALSRADTFSKALLISPAVWKDLTNETATADWIIFKDENGQIDNDKWHSLHPASKLQAYKDQDNVVDFFVITGGADETVSVKSVQNFADQLSEVAPVELVVIEDGIHGWTTWEEATKQSLEFLGKH